MRIEFDENKFGANFTIHPETPAEVAQLLRLSRNAKAEKPDIYFSFSNDAPYCNIWMKKVKENVQRNSINNKNH